MAGVKIFSKKVLTNEMGCAIIKAQRTEKKEMEETEMEWYNVEAEKLHQELMERNIKHEMSAAYNLIHFEILLNKAQVNSMNKLIDNIRKRNGAIFNV